MFPLRGAASLYLLLVSVLCAIQVGTTNEGRVVCYYTNWSVYRPGTAKFNPQNINPYLCTHLIYAFGGFTKDNALKPFDKYQDIEKGGFSKFTGLKTYNKNLKTMIAIGGWNEGSSRFSPLVASPERRQQLVKNTIKFLRQNHFDGLDLDWEYPAFRDGGKSRDRDNYAQLVQELREEFDRESKKTGRPRLLLTMAVPAGIEYIEKGYDIPKLNKYLDWFNILTYDYHSAFEPSVNHHAPLYPLEEDNEYNYDTELNIDYTVKFYLNIGADKDKLVLGIPTYGRSYTLFNVDATEIGSPTDGPGDQGDATREKGYLAYYEICQNIKDDPEWTVVHPNDQAMGPYAFKDNQWVGYDDEAIARKKAEYVAANHLGGIMFWSIDNDDFRGTCHGRPYPIIEAAKEAMYSRLGDGDNDVIKSTRTKAPSTRQRSRQGTSSKNRINEDTNTISKTRITSTKETPSQRRKTLRNRTTTTTPRTPSTTEETYIIATRTTPSPPTTPDPGSDFRCEDEGFYPHPRDCKKYFWCLDSGPSNLGIVAHQFTCPSGLYFNKAADSCDYSRNVLCSKTTKSPETTTTSTTTARTTTTTIRSRITAATSKNSFLRSTTTPSTTTTTEAVEYEYEDEEEESKSPGLIDDAEDPRVIKELIDLIKKVGGIEELEKQLKAQEESSASFKNSNSQQITTTPAAISKNLYEKILSRAAANTGSALRNRFNGATGSDKKFSSGNNSGSRDTVNESTDDTKTKYSSVVRNSRPSQTAGLENLPEFEGFLKERPKYVTITRTRPTLAAGAAHDDEDEEDGEEVDKDNDDDDDDEQEQPVRNKIVRESQTEATFVRHTLPQQYVSIQRTRPTVPSVVKEENNDNEEDTDDDTLVTKSRITTESGSNSGSQYVNIKRRRPASSDNPKLDKEEEKEHETETAAPVTPIINRYQLFSRRTEATTIQPFGNTESSDFTSSAATTSAAADGDEFDEGESGATMTTTTSVPTSTYLSTTPLSSNIPETTTRAYANIARRTTSTQIPIDLTTITQEQEKSIVTELPSVKETMTTPVSETVVIIRKTIKTPTSSEITTTINPTNNFTEVTTENISLDSSTENPNAQIEIDSTQHPDLPSLVNDAETTIQTITTTTITVPKALGLDQTTTITIPTGSDNLIDTNSNSSKDSKNDDDSNVNNNEIINITTTTVTPQPLGINRRTRRPVFNSRTTTTTTSPEATTSTTTTEPRKVSFNFPYTGIKPRTLKNTLNPSSSPILSSFSFSTDRQENDQKVQVSLKSKVDDERNDTVAYLNNRANRTNRTNQTNETNETNATNQTNQTNQISSRTRTTIRRVRPVSSSRRLSSVTNNQNSLSNNTTTKINSLPTVDQSKRIKNVTLSDSSTSETEQLIRQQSIRSRGRGRSRFSTVKPSTEENYSSYSSSSAAVNRQQPQRAFRPNISYNDGSYSQYDDKSSYLDRTLRPEVDSDLSSLTSADIFRARKIISDGQQTNVVRRTRPTRTTTTAPPSTYRDIYGEEGGAENDEDLYRNRQENNRRVTQSYGFTSRHHVRGRPTASSAQSTASSEDEVSKSYEDYEDKRTLRPAILPEYSSLTSGDFGRTQDRAITSGSGRVRPIRPTASTTVAPEEAIVDHDNETDNFNKRRPEPTSRRNEVFNFQIRHQIRPTTAPQETDDFSSSTSQETTTGRRFIEKSKASFRFNQNVPSSSSESLERVTTTEIPSSVTVNRFRFNNFQSENRVTDSPIIQIKIDTTPLSREKDESKTTSSGRRLSLEKSINFGSAARKQIGEKEVKTRTDNNEETLQLARTSNALEQSKIIRPSASQPASSSGSRFSFGILVDQEEGLSTTTDFSTTKSTGIDERTENIFALQINDLISDDDLSTSTMESDINTASDSGSIKTTTIKQPFVFSFGTQPSKGTKITERIEIGTLATTESNTEKDYTLSSATTEQSFSSFESEKTRTDEADRVAGFVRRRTTTTERGGDGTTVTEPSVTKSDDISSRVAKTQINFNRSNRLRLTAAIANNRTKDASTTNTEESDVSEEAVEVTSSRVRLGGDRANLFAGRSRIRTTTNVPVVSTEESNVSGTTEETDTSSTLRTNIIRLGVNRLNRFGGRSTTAIPDGTTTDNSVSSESGTDDTAKDNLSSVTTEATEPSPVTRINNIRLGVNRFSGFARRPTTTESIIDSSSEDLSFVTEESDISGEVDDVTIKTGARIQLNRIGSRTTAIIPESSTTTDSSGSVINENVTSTESSSSVTTEELLQSTSEIPATQLNPVRIRRPFPTRIQPIYTRQPTTGSVSTTSEDDEENEEEVKIESSTETTRNTFQRTRPTVRSFRTTTIQPSTQTTNDGDTDSSTVDQSTDNESTSTSTPASSLRGRIIGRLSFTTTTATVPTVEEEGDEDDNNSTLSLGTTSRRAGITTTQERVTPTRRRIITRPSTEATVKVEEEQGNIEILANRVEVNETSENVTSHKHPVIRKMIRKRPILKVTSNKTTVQETEDKEVIAHPRIRKILRKRPSTTTEKVTENVEVTSVKTDENKGEKNQEVKEELVKIQEEKVDEKEPPQENVKTEESEHGIIEKTESNDTETTSRKGKVLDKILNTEEENVTEKDDDNDDDDDDENPTTVVNISTTPQTTRRYTVRSRGPYKPSKPNVGQLTTATELPASTPRAFIPSRIAGRILTRPRAFTTNDDATANNRVSIRPINAQQNRFSNNFRTTTESSEDSFRPSFRPSFSRSTFSSSTKEVDNDDNSDDDDRFDGDDDEYVDDNYEAVQRDRIENINSVFANKNNDTDGSHEEEEEEKEDNNENITDKIDNNDDQNEDEDEDEDEQVDDVVKTDDNEEERKPAYVNKLLKQNRPSYKPANKRPIGNNSNVPFNPRSTTIHPASSRYTPSINQPVTPPTATNTNVAAKTVNVNYLEGLDQDALNARNKKIFNANNKKHLTTNQTIIQQEQKSDKESSDTDATTIISDIYNTIDNNNNNNNKNSNNINTDYTTMNIDDKEYTTILPSQLDDTEQQQNEQIDVNRHTSITDDDNLINSNKLQGSSAIPSGRPLLSTTTKPTTLHHVFAIDYDTTEDLTKSSNRSASSSKSSSSTESTMNQGSHESGEEIVKQHHKLVEVNRIVEVYSKQDNGKNNQIDSGKLVLEKVPTLDKLGEISRTTLIKVIDHHNKTQNATLQIPTPPLSDTNTSDDDNNRQGKSKNIISPEYIFSVETSTIPLEGLFQRQSKQVTETSSDGKSINVVYATSLGETPAERPSPIFIQGTIPNESQNNEAIIVKSSSKPIRPIVPLLRPETNESTPLVISIANLDQVILTKGAPVSPIIATTTTTTTTTTTEAPTIANEIVEPQKTDGDFAFSGRVSTVIGAPSSASSLQEVNDGKNDDTAVHALNDAYSSEITRVIKKKPNNINDDSSSNSNNNNKNNNNNDKNLFDFKTMLPIPLEKARNINAKPIKDENIIETRPQLLRPNNRRPIYNPRITNTLRDSNNRATSQNRGSNKTDADADDVATTTPTAASIFAAKPTSRRRGTRPTYTSTTTSATINLNKKQIPPRTIVRRKFGGLRPNGDSSRTSTSTTTTKAPDAATVDQSRTTNTLFKRRYTFSTTTPRPQPHLQTSTGRTTTSTTTTTTSTTSKSNLIDDDDIDDDDELLSKEDQELEPSINQENKFANSRYNQIGEPTIDEEYLAAIKAISSAPLPAPVTTTTARYTTTYRPIELTHNNRNNFFTTIQQTQYESPTTRRADITTRRTIIRRPQKLSTTYRPIEKISTTSHRPRRPQPFEKKLPTAPAVQNEFVGRTYRPVLDYDYYDDGDDRIIGKSNSQVKVILHGHGIIECLDQGNFPHPLSCRKFISCAKMENGGVVGWEYTCPRNLSYDPVGGICNWAAGLGCKE